MAAIIPVPAELTFETAKVTLSRATFAMRSKYTGKRQVAVLPYALWLFEGKVPKMAQHEPGTGAIRGFLTDLEGQANKFRLPVPGVTTPLSGYAGSAGYVSGAGQTGRVLVTTGWTPNAVVLKRGDYFNVGDELKVAAGDVVANGSGQAAILFNPPLRSSPANALALGLTNPTVMLSAQTDDVASWDLTSPVIHAFALKAIEAID